MLAWIWARGRSALGIFSLFWFISSLTVVSLPSLIWCPWDGTVAAPSVKGMEGSAAVPVPGRVEPQATASQAFNTNASCCKNYLSSIAFLLDREPVAMPYWPFSSSDFWSYVEYFRTLGAYNRIAELARALFAQLPAGSHLGLHRPVREE